MYFTIINSYKIKLNFKNMIIGHLVSQFEDIHDLSRANLNT